MEKEIIDVYIEGLYDGMEAVNNLMEKELGYKFKTIRKEELKKKYCDKNTTASLEE